MKKKLLYGLMGLLVALSLALFVACDDDDDDGDGGDDGNTTTITNSDGSVTKTTTNSDGSVTTTTTYTDGSSTTIEYDSSGNVVSKTETDSSGKKSSATVSATYVWSKSYTWEETYTLYFYSDSTFQIDYYQKETEGDDVDEISGTFATGTYSGTLGTDSAISGEISKIAQVAAYDYLDLYCTLYGTPSLDDYKEDSGFLTYVIEDFGFDEDSTYEELLEETSEDFMFEELCCYLADECYDEYAYTLIDWGADVGSGDDTLSWEDDSEFASGSTSLTFNFSGDELTIEDTMYIAGSKGYFSDDETFTKQ